MMKTKQNNHAAADFGGYTMKRTMILMTALVLALGAVSAPDADAGWFNKDKAQRTEKPEWMKKAQRYNDLPTMSFHSGVLQQDGISGWKLGETNVQFAKDCRITTDGVEGASLDAGREAVVMGPKFGDTILAWSVRIQQPEFSVGHTTSSEVQLQYSETNPNCGEVIKAPR